MAFINESCGTGSIGKLTLDLMQDLTSRGVEAFCFYSKASSVSENAFKIGNDLDHKLHAILSRITGLQGYFSHIPTIRLINKLKGMKVDLVVLENLHSNYVNLKLLFTYLNKFDVPTVLILHDCWIFTGKCTYYVSAKCDKWMTECGNCPLLHIDNVNPTLFFDRTGKCHKDKMKLVGRLRKACVIGVSEWVAKEAGMSYLKRFQIRTIRNWIDVSTFHKMDSEPVRAKYGIPLKKTVLMVSSNISQIKGYDEMVYLSQILDESYQIIAVGRNIRNLHIPQGVIHIPYTSDQNELAQIYNLADVCVNTTKYETFGMVTAEALCCGTPVIVYNNTASKELVDDECGAVVEDGNKEELVRAVHRICMTGKAWYTERCIKAGNERFDPAKAMGAYFEAFSSIVT